MDKNIIDNDKDDIKNLSNDFSRLLKKYANLFFKKSIETSAESINKMIDDGNIIVNKKIDKYTKQGTK